MIFLCVSPSSLLFLQISPTQFLLNSSSFCSAQWSSCILLEFLLIMLQWPRNCFATESRIDWRAHLLSFHSLRELSRVLPVPIVWKQLFVYFCLVVYLFMEGGIVLYYLLIRARSRDRILTFKQLRSVVFKKSHTVDFDLLVVLHNCVSTYLYFKFKISNLSNWREDKEQL